jgi:hypothetical protein
VARFVALSSLLAAAACGDNLAPPDPPVVVGACDATVTEVPLEPGIHVEVGAPIEWSSNPPATGRHFPAWAGWDRAYDDLERGYWVHNLEHGGVVLLYRCDEACPDVVAQLEDVARAAPVDPLCASPLRNRVLVVADPLLPDGVTVAASAWGFTYTASCVDPSLATFVAEHLAEGPEDTCANGFTTRGTFIDP